MKVLDQSHGERFAIYQADCVEAVRGLPDASVHYSIFSPPFASLYTYSASPRDLGNSLDGEQFADHLAFLIGIGVLHQDLLGGLVQTIKLNAGGFNVKNETGHLNRLN